MKPIKPPILRAFIYNRVMLLDDFECCCFYIHCFLETRENDKKKKKNLITPLECWTWNVGHFHVFLENNGGEKNNSGQFEVDPGPAPDPTTRIDRFHFNYLGIKCATKLI